MSEEPISNPTVRSAVDRVFAHHSPIGFLLLAGGMSIMVVMILSLLVPIGSAGSDGAEAATPLLNRIIAALVVIAATAGLGGLWIVRRYYRRIYGSEYHRR